MWLPIRSYVVSWTGKYHWNKAPMRAENKNRNKAKTTKRKEKTKQNKGKTTTTESKCQQSFIIIQNIRMYWLPTRKKLLFYTVANSARRGLLNRGKTKKSLAAHPLPPPQRCPFDFILTTRFLVPGSQTPNTSDMLSTCLHNILYILLH